MLLGSLAAWIVFNVPLGFIRPPATSCLVYNTSGFFIETPKTLTYGYNTARTNLKKKRSIQEGAFGVDDGGAGDYYDYEGDEIIGWTQKPPNSWAVKTSTSSSSPSADNIYSSLPVINDYPKDDNNNNNLNDDEYAQIPWNQLLAMEVVNLFKFKELSY